MATMAQLDTFQGNLNALVTLAQRDLSDFWRTIDTTDITFVRMMLEEFYPDLVQTYGSTAAVLAADFFDELRDVPPSAGRFRAVLAEPVAVDDAMVAARWGIAPLLGGQPDRAAALTHVADATQRLILQPARSTIITSAFKDSVRTGVARVPNGDTCAFCLMLASQGPVYTNDPASVDIGKFHTKCNCKLVTIRTPEDVPEGYDPDALYEKYADVHEPGMSARETTQAMRDAYGLK